MPNTQYTFDDILWFLGYGRDVIQAQNDEIERLRQILELCCYTPPEPPPTPDPGYLTFISRDNDNYIELIRYCGVTPNIYYSIDGGQWVDWGADGYERLYLPDGHFVRMYGYNPNGFSFSESAYSTFFFKSPTDSSGNTMSLISQYMPDEIPNDYCFYRLFFQSDMLLSAPEVPATVLMGHCYQEMFEACRRLATPPSSIPAETINKYACRQMFAKCGSLQRGPDIAARKLEESACESMFYESGLITTPYFAPDVLVSDACCRSMFMFCQSLTSCMEELPCQMMQTSCYESMFSCCMNLRTPPRLPAGILAGYCYAHMFEKAGLTVTTPLTALTMMEGCYEAMFAGTLITEPTPLDSTSLAPRCYAGMFSGTYLQYMLPLPATRMETSCYENMFSGTQIPTILQFNDVNGIAASTLAPGCFKYMFSACQYLSSVPDLPYTALTAECYFGMYNSCTGLTECPALPSENLARSCYGYMFVGCTSLTSGVTLPATVLADNCYEHMFEGCDLLVDAPALPAMTLAPHCYEYMFYRCSSLVNPPALPATALTEYCYSNMFRQCPNIVEAPVLPAVQPVLGCYEGMFNCLYNTSQLSRITCYLDNDDSGQYTGYWLGGNTTLGVFYKPSTALNWPRNESGIPTDWVIIYIN